MGRITGVGCSTKMLINQDYPDCVYKWAAELGAEKNSIARLNGGINNLAFRCGTNRESWVIKVYGEKRRDGYERMRREATFMSIANRIAPRYCPRLLHVDYDNCCIAMEFVDGDTIRRGMTPSTMHIQKAIDFMKLLNAEAHNQSWSEMPRAAEAFLSLTDHLNNIESRIKKMSVEHLEKEMRDRAASIMDILRNEYDEIHKKVTRRIDAGLAKNSIEEHDTWLSPGDFGFHNAVCGDKDVKFIDFEFAGLDDPAKTIIDFNLQPRNLIGLGRFYLLEAVDVAMLDSVLKRCSDLLPILRIKWVCIILNILVPDRLEEIVPSSGTVRSNTIEWRLNTAEMYCLRFRETALSPQRYWVH